MNLNQARTVHAELQDELRQAEDDLQRAEAEVAEKRGNVEELRSVVKALDARIYRLTLNEKGITEAREAREARLEPLERPPAADAEAEAVRVPRGENAMAAILKRIMADGKQRNVNEVMSAYRSTINGPMPKRVSFTNRLNEIVGEGYLVRVKRGVYELASQNGTTRPIQDAHASATLDEELGSETAAGSDQSGGGTQLTGATTGVAGRI